jgi:hypothetical protein
MAQRSSGFDISKLSTASKILLGAGVLFLIDLFLPWRRACGESILGSICVSQSGVAQGVGILNLLLVLAILVMEGLTLANVQVNMGTAQQRLQIEAGLAGALLLFTIIKVLIGLSHVYIFTFVGLLLAIAIGYAGWMRWQEAQLASGTSTPPPPPPSPGGFSA